ncbi:MAG: helix-hairpin-helix domain-containing protein [Actinobacteria bacterium]|nr:helix-hairpin-helix domain-containing protein [Actinomycetota bacterium]
MTNQARGRGASPSAKGEDEQARRALDRLRVGDGVGDRPTRFCDVREIASGLVRWASASMQRLVLVVTAVLFVALISAVVFVKYSTSSTRSVLSSSSSISSQVEVVSTTTTTGPSVVVDIGGAVRSPGVYRLTLGSRVIDALERAGGPAEDIDTGRVNLAAPLVDGERVWLPRRGESLDGVVSGLASGAGGGQGSLQSTVPLDLNSATVEQLNDLPGVGPATAKAIIETRKAAGRFRSVDDLLTVKGIGPSKLDAIRSSVVVR